VPLKTDEMISVEDYLSAELRTEDVCAGLEL
jgi:hypothetical protein